MPFKVLVVDDQKMQRKALEAYISETPDFEVADVLHNAELAVGYCFRGDVDLVLMDIVMMTGMNGIEACGRIKKKKPKTKVVLVTSMLDASFLTAAREVGADALWYKEEENEELAEVCRRVMEGEEVYPDCAPCVNVGDVGSAEFTDGEMEVLRALVKGGTDQEIADELHLSVWTVRSYVRSLLQKTGYRNRVELAAPTSSSSSGV